MAIGGRRRGGEPLTCDSALAQRKTRIHPRRPTQCPAQLQFAIELARRLSRRIEPQVLENPFGVDPCEGAVN